MNIRDAKFGGPNSKNDVCTFVVGYTNVTKEEDRNNVTKVPPNIFGQENLSDCGFNKELLSHFCNPDPARIEVFESFKFFNGLYTWS